MFSEKPSRCGLAYRVIKTILPEYNLREEIKVQYYLWVYIVV